MSEPEGGDAVCWLERVCDACGALADGPAPAVCERCGSAGPDGGPSLGAADPS